MFKKKTQKQAILEAMTQVECTLSMMKISAITLKESDGGFMTSSWDIYCRPYSPGKVRIFWVAVLDAGDGTMKAVEMDERVCDGHDSIQIADQFISLFVSVTSRYGRQRAVDVLAEATKKAGPEGLTIDYIRAVTAEMNATR